MGAGSCRVVRTFISSRQRPTGKLHDLHGHELHNHTHVMFYGRGVGGPPSQSQRPPTNIGLNVMFSTGTQSESLRCSRPPLARVLQDVGPAAPNAFGSLFGIYSKTSTDLLSHQLPWASASCSIAWRIECTSTAKQSEAGLAAFRDSQAANYEKQKTILSTWLVYSSLLTRGYFIALLR